MTNKYLNEICAKLPRKAARLRDNERRNRLAHAEIERRQKLLNNYLNSNRVTQLRNAMYKANDDLSILIQEWNDIILAEE